MKCSKCGMPNFFLQEDYVAPVTVSYPQWVRMISEGNTRPFVDIVYPSSTVANGAVIPGHVRQNVMTANFPYTPIQSSVGDMSEDIPVWNS